MARGQRTPDKTRAEILAVYELTGNAAEAARQTGVAGNTAWKIVQQALDDGSLADAGSRLRKRAIDAAERAIIAAMGLAAERATDEQWCNGFNSDPGPNYLKNLIDSHKTLCAAEARVAEKREAAQLAAVTIEVRGPVIDTEGEPVADEETDDNEPVSND